MASTKTTSENTQKICCVKRTTPLREISHHSHDCWEIVLQLSGEYTAIIGDKTHHIRPGDILAIPPHIVHGGKCIVPFKDIFVQIPHIEFPAFLFAHDDDGSVKTLMDMLHKAQTEQEFMWEDISSKLIDALVSYITKLAKTERKYPFVYEIKNQIYEHLSDSNFSIADTVADSGFHPDYFRRCFKEEFGTSPIVYVTNLRMEQAKKLLTLSLEYSVAEIAERCGFKDSFYFSKCFKKHTGYAPLEYRKHHRT